MIWRRFLYLVFTLFAACSERTANEPAPQAAPDAPVIVISIDTLRADHLPAYGYNGVATPALDAFRRDAILFRHAYAPTPMTLPSHLTMLTGLLPTEHGVRDNVGFRFDGAKHRSVASLLRAKGYATGAAVSSFVLRSETGIADGFDLYDDAVAANPGGAFADFQRSGAVTEKAAEEWIARTGSRPFFFFLHLYEPHVPYDPPEPFRSQYANAYDGEIAAADAIVGRFLGFLKARALYDKALIVITSDHGEGLNDHGEDQHSILIYREAIHVPLFVKLPQSEDGGTTIDSPASLADVTPTILTLLGIAHPTARNATSLLSLPKTRAIYSESLYPRYHFGWSELRSLVDDRWHYIEAPRPELYDIQRDPAERSDLASNERRELDRLRRALAPYRDAAPAVGTVDPETAAKLKALGYVGTARNRGDGPLPNPHEEVRHLAPMREGIALSAAGRTEQAIAIFRSILAKSPAMLEVRTELAEALARSGRLDDAEREYRTAIAQAEVFSTDLTLALGEVHLQQGKLADARRAADASLTAAPRRARTLLARTALAERKIREAMTHARTLADAPDAHPADLLLVAEVQQAAGDFARSLTTIAAAETRGRALELPPLYRLEFLRADALARLDRTDEAIAAYRRELTHFPRHLRAYSNLAILHFVSGNPAAMEATLRQLVTANPGPASRALAERTRAALR